MMKSKSNGLAICYNVQAAVDEKNKIVVAVDVTNEATDYKQLHNISRQAKENIHVEKITAVADAGYLFGS